MSVIVKRKVVAISSAGKLPALLITLLLMTGCLVEVAHAQWYLNENLVFAFGNYTGLDFRTGSPVVIPTGVSGVPNSTRPPGHTVTGLANASVCDANGNLLFYTNGSHIWDSTHTPMPNALPLHNSSVNVVGYTQTSPQGALIVPFIGDPYRYYVFSHISPALSGELFYSVVDMRLNNGKGDVVPGQKWIRIGTNLVGTLIGIPGNECNVWVVVHVRDTNQFRVFEVTGAGLNTVPQIQTVGNYAVVPPNVPGGVNPNYWREGFLHASTDGKHIVMSATGGKAVELFDFDAFNGTISNPVIIDSGYRARCAIFSPGDSKIYVTSERDDGQPYWGIYQFEADYANKASIRASKKLISTCRIPETHLKLAPDGKLYFINSRSNTGFPSFSGRDIGVIHRPDMPGALCQFDSFAVKLDTSTIAIYGFSNYIVRENDSTTRRTDTIVCGPFQPMPLQAPAGYASYEWNDGSSGSSMIIPDRGLYWVRCINNCIVRTDTFFVGGADVDFELGPDIVVCENPQPVTLEIMLNDADLLWSDGSAGKQLTVDKSGIYWAQASNKGCTKADTIDIFLTHIPQDLGPDTLICITPDIKPAYALHARLPSEHASLLWNTGHTGISLPVSETGWYWVEATDGACSDRDSVYVEFADVSQALGADTLICHDQPVNLILYANVPPGGQAAWSNGSGDREIRVTDSGYYSVRVSYGHCLGSDDIRISKEMCRCQVRMPDAFTPNGDGRNDVFRPATEPGCIVNAYNIQVYNRWGEQVYTGMHGSDITKGWDGTFKGIPAEPGTYMYMLSLESGEERELIRYQGSILLIR